MIYDVYSSSISSIRIFVNHNSGRPSLSQEDTAALGETSLFQEGIMEDNESSLIGDRNAIDRGINTKGYFLHKVVVSFKYGN